MIQPIVKSKLYESVSHQIIGQIKTGAWAEGARIPTETELAAQFHVGRNSIREAVKSLQLTGILESSPGRGTFVTQDALRGIRLSELLGLLSDQEYLTDLIETRLVLESQMAYLAATRANEEQLSAMEKIIAAMRACESKEELLEQGYLFHSEVAKASGNKILIGFYDSISAQLLRQRDLEFLTLEVYRRGIDDHEAVLNAIRQKDAALAMELMERHLRQDYRRYLGDGERD